MRFTLFLYSWVIFDRVSILSFAVSKTHWRNSQIMSMQEDSNALITHVEAQSENGGHAAEPCQKITRNYRRLRSLSTNRMLHQEKDPPRCQEGVWPYSLVCLWCEEKQGDRNLLFFQRFPEHPFCHRGIRIRPAKESQDIPYSKDTKKVQRKLNFYMYKWLFRVKPYIIALF